MVLKSLFSMIAFKLGYLGAFLFPYSIVCKFKGWLEIIYTGYISRGFKHFGRNSKIEHGLHLAGKQYISIGDNVFIGKNSALTAFNVAGNVELSIGNRCMFGYDNHITCCNKIIIGNDLRTGKSVLISDNAHGDPKNVDQKKMNPNDRPLYSKDPIIIGDCVWIGERAVILGGVKIGNGAIVGANSVVTHDIPENGIAVGCPARIIMH